MMEPELINLDSSALGTFRRFLAEAEAEDNKDNATKSIDSDILALSRELRSTNLRMIHRLLENPLNQLISTALARKRQLDEEEGRMYLYDARRPDYRDDAMEWDESSGMCVKMIVYNTDSKEYRLKNNKHTVGHAVMRRQTFKGAHNTPSAGWRKHEYKLVLREKLFRPDSDGTLAVIEAQRLQELPVLVHYFFKNTRPRKRKQKCLPVEIGCEPQPCKRRKSSDVREGEAEEEEEDEEEEGETWNRWRSHEAGEESTAERKPRVLRGLEQRASLPHGAVGGNHHAVRRGQERHAQMGQGVPGEGCAAAAGERRVRVGDGQCSLTTAVSAFYGGGQPPPPPPPSPPTLGTSLASALAYASAMLHPPAHSSNSPHSPHSPHSSHSSHSPHSLQAAVHMDEGDGDGAPEEDDFLGSYSSSTSSSSSSSSCSSSPSAGSVLSATAVPIGRSFASHTPLDLDRLLSDEPLNYPKSPQPLSSASLAPPADSQARLLSYAPDVGPWCSHTTVIVVVDGFPEVAPSESFQCVIGNTSVSMKRVYGNAFEVVVPPSSCSGAVSFWCSCEFSGRSIYTNPRPFYYTPTSQADVLKLNFHSIGAYTNTDRKQVVSKFVHTVRALDLSSNGLTTVSFLDGMVNLDSLILDDNALGNELALPFLPSLRTLSLNVNRISALEKLLPNLRSSVPSLQYLSLLNNEANPYFSRRQHHYYNFRIYVVSCLPSLTHLDATAVTIEELRHATSIMGDEEDTAGAAPLHSLFRVKVEQCGELTPPAGTVAPPMLARDMNGSALRNESLHPLWSAGDTPPPHAPRTLLSGEAAGEKGMAQQKHFAGHTEDSAGARGAGHSSLLDGLGGTPAHSPALAMFDSVIARSPRGDGESCWRTDSDFWRN